MALDATRLAAAIQPELESKIRSMILSGDATPYPNLTNFTQAIAESIANQVIAEITDHAVVAGISGATVYSLPGGTGSTVGYLNNVTVTGEID